MGPRAYFLKWHDRPIDMVLEGGGEPGALLPLDRYNIIFLLEGRRRGIGVMLNPRRGPIDNVMAAAVMHSIRVLVGDPHLPWDDAVVRFGARVEPAELPEWFVEALRRV